MNPLIIESAIQTALNASAFTTTQIYTGTSYAEITPESLNLIVSVESISHTLGNLYKAEANIKVSAPALFGSASYSNMFSVLQTLKSSMTNTYFNANWPTSIPLATTIPAFAGVWERDTKSTQEDHEWVVVINADFGIAV